MATRLALVVVVGVLWGASHPTQGAQDRAQVPESRAYTASTTAVLVDVVVCNRDSGGPVLDLTADDFALFEDGVRQKIDTFTRVSRGGGIGIDVKWRKPETVAVVTGPDAATEESSPPAPMASTAALVFDHLSSDALALAQRATLQYVPVGGDAETSVAVFATDPGFRVLQGYTTDRAAVRNAVRKVLPAGTSAAERTADRRDQIIDRQQTLSAEMTVSATTTAGAAAAQAGNEIGAREQELQLLKLERSMIESFDSMDRDHRGYGTTASLTAVVRTLVERPGRKSIVFFSEGLPVSPVLAARLDGLIEMANRANVTVYAIDARGLRTESSLEEARKEMEAFGQERLAQLASGSTAVDRPMMRDFERVEDTVRLDTRVGLARLSSDTGGFLIDGSNDLSNAFRRIDEDNRFHYVLSYSPKKPLGDGGFRTIQVKVARPGTTVFSRKGYRASPAPRSIDGLGFEAPALALLDRSPLPNAFQVGAAAFSFPEPTHPGTTAIVVSLSTETLRFDIDQALATYSAQAGIVVRIKDRDGQPVQMVSQQYVLSGAAKDVDAARRGEILFYRQPDLKPGVYTVEVVAMDIVANKGSVRMSTLTVPASQSSSVAMSSLVLVDRTEEVAEAPPEQAGQAPLYVGQRLLYPNVGKPIVKAVTPELPFYFALYGDVRAVASGSVQLLKQGRAIAEGPLTLPTANGSPLQHVGHLPVAALPAGTYELRVRVAAAGRELSRTAFFTLQ
jgi:VWFA-related protein